MDSHRAYAKVVFEARAFFWRLWSSHDHAQTNATDRGRAETRFHHAQGGASVAPGVWLVHRKTEVPLMSDRVERTEHPSRDFSHDSVHSSAASGFQTKRRERQNTVSSFSIRVQPDEGYVQQDAQGCAVLPATQIDSIQT